MTVTVSMIYSDTGRICETRIVEATSVVQATEDAIANMSPSQRERFHVQAGQFHKARKSTNTTLQINKPCEFARLVSFPYTENRRKTPVTVLG